MTTSKSILYICPGTITLKEIENAIYFALNLKKAGFSNYFLAFPFGARLIRKYGFFAEELRFNKKDNYRIFKRVCERTNPGWILIADGYLFDFWFGPKYIFNIEWIVDNPVGAKFASFDNLCLSIRSKILPFYSSSNIEDKFKWLRTTSLTKLMPVLIPCPYTFPVSKSDNEKSSIFYYRRSNEWLKWNEDQKKSFRDSIGIKKEEKLVLFSISEWPVRITRAITEDVDIWLRYFSHIVKMIFQEVKGKTTLLVISTYPLFNSSTEGYLKIINWDLLPYDIYIKFLLTADLFITTSAISSSIVKAVMGKVPAACLISSGGELKESRLSSQLINWFKTARAKYPDLLRSYLVFPIGWQEILTFIFEKNPYRDTFEFLDLLKPMATINTINDLLFNKEKRESLIQKQNSYIKQINHLPGPERIMNFL